MCLKGCIWVQGSFQYELMILDTALSYFSSNSTYINQEALFIIHVTICNIFKAFCEIVILWKVEYQNLGQRGITWYQDQTWVTLSFWVYFTYIQLGKFTIRFVRNTVLEEQRCWIRPWDRYYLYRLHAIPARTIFFVASSRVGEHGLVLRNR